MIFNAGERNGKTPKNYIERSSKKSSTATKRLRGFFVRKNF